MGSPVQLFAFVFSCYDGRAPGRLRGGWARRRPEHDSPVVVPPFHATKQPPAPRAGFPVRSVLLVAVTPSASYSITARLAITNRPGMLRRVAMAIGDAGGDIGAVDLVESTRDHIVRDITISSRDSTHGQQIVNRL